MPCGSQQGCIAQSVSRLTALTGLLRSAPNGYQPQKGEKRRKDL